MSLPVITLTSPASKITGAPEIVKTTPFPTSYLDNGAEETFMLKLGVPTQHHHHVFHLGKNSTDDREIEVFDAEKYFNEGLNRVPTDDPKNLPEKKKLDEPIDEPAVPKLVSTLKSTRSETSSTNSRSALLRSHSRKLQPRKSLIRKGFLASISCSNCCKNSLEIDGSSLDNISRDHSVKKHGNHQALEPSQKNRANSLTLEKKLNLMSWAGEDIKIPNGDDGDDGDGDSDASSDLFEIESISRGRPFLSRQASGRTACYPPSEASIEWSVVTASAADFSALSDSEEFRSYAFAEKTPRRSDQNHQIINSKMIKEIPKLRPGILSGCRSQKAVSVAGDAHRAMMRETTTEYPMAALTRFRDENGKLGGFSAKIRPQSFDHTARVVRSGANAAHLLYT